MPARSQAQRLDLPALLEFEAIAARLGLSVQTVQVQAARGLRRVAEDLRRRLKTP